MAKEQGQNICRAVKCCPKCLVWWALAESRDYRKAEGVRVRSLGGTEGKYFLFRYDSKAARVHVWRPYSNYDFTFGELDCQALCQRFQEWRTGNPFRTIYARGVTSFFTDPKWRHPILGRRKTPAAGAVIAHMLESMQLDPNCQR
jgi:hypothetical protein